MFAIVFDLVGADAAGIIPAVFLPPIARLARDGTVRVNMPLTTFLRLLDWKQMLEQIRQRLRVIPFQPFMVHCSSGDVFRVEHPENAAVVAHTVTIALPDGGNVITLGAPHIVGVSGVDRLAA